MSENLRKKMETSTLYQRNGNRREDDNSEGKYRQYFVNDLLSVFPM